MGFRLPSDDSREKKGCGGGNESIEENRFHRLFPYRFPQGFHLGSLPVQLH